MGSSPPRPWHGCHLLAIILLVFQLLPSASAAPCDANNVGKTYTTCVANKRTALYYWLVPCEESGYSLPPNKYNLPCDKLCSSGYYLPFGETECAPCQPGEYSLGTGEIINEWDTLPPSMSVDCDGLACQDWVPSGHYIHSGSNQNAHNSSVNLRLVANFVLQTGNKIQFRYMVDSQDCSLDCDGLVFYIDGVAKTPMISRQRTWATLEFDLNTGFHDFTWAFVKDYSGTFGEDRAAIKWIHLIGTTFSHETCSQCTAGTYSDAIAAPECTLCDYNHFNPERGATKCEPCSPGYYAFQGALNCTLLPKCESRHIFSSRTTCKVPELTQDIVYQYLTLDDGHVRTCNENLPGSTPLPASIRNVPCYCPPGEWLKSNGQCEYCPEGQARMNETSCHTCPIGTAASKAMYFADWSHIPSRFTVRCIGPCDTMGWIARGDHVDAGYGGANDEQALLELENVELITSGVLEFHYTLSGRCFVFCTSRIIITDVAQNEVIASDILKTGTSKVYQRELPPGKYTLTWRFTMNFGLFETLTLMKIHSISLSGVAVGGAPACVSCPLGTEGLRAGISSCKPCDIGHYSDTPGQLCKLADAGFFVDAPGASAQIPCGAGTTSNAARTDCDTDCTFTYPASGDKRGYKYDLRSLYNPEVMNFAGTDLYSHQYFLNLCSRVHKNSTCFNADGEPIPTFGCQQVNGWNYATDLGHVIGFEAGEDPSQGLMISLTQGTPGCASRYGSKVPRSTTVSMVCDVSAGIGSPKPAYPDSTVEYPAGSCTYHFVWRSAYACPVCTPDDYEVSLSDCLNGIKVKSYVRKIDCWDPQPLPSEEIPCQSCPMDKNGLICSNHGTCNEFTGVCDCEVSWSGSVCASCSVGHFGADCAQVCPGGRALPCDGHGVCDSGLLGTGECTCSTGWAGNACSTCAEGFEGDKCTAKPASVGDVVPWWGFLILFGGVGIIVVIAIVLWRQKKQVEYKYTSLLRNQPLEMEGNENNIEIEDDDDEEDVADRNW